MSSGVTYSGIYPKRITTLPSVETWGTNMNILKDPPKSIHTTRKDKIGDVQSIVMDQEDSSDRINEMINVYPRGQNPFVKVQYSNDGTSGGQNRQNGSAGTVGVSAFGGVKMAHTTMRDGEFRPPVRTDFDLLPLSRLPRGNIQVNTNKGNTRKLMESTNCGDLNVNTQAIKKCNNLPKNANVPNYVYKTTHNQQQRENFIPSKSIRNSNYNNVNTIKTGPVKENLPRSAPSRAIVEKFQHFDYTVPKGSDVLYRTVDNNNKNISESINNNMIKGQFQTNHSRISNGLENSEKYQNNAVKNQINTGMTTNHVKNYGSEQFTEIEELQLTRNKPISNVTTNIKGSYDVSNKHENTVKLNRNMPNYSMQAHTFGVGDTTQNSGREYNRLQQKADPNSIFNQEMNQYKPGHKNQNNYKLDESNLQNVNKKAFEYFEQRYQN